MEKSKEFSWNIHISKTRKSVSSDFQTLRSGLKTQGVAECFLTQMFGNQVKRYIKCLILLLKLINNS